MMALAGVGRFTILSFLCILGLALAMGFVLSSLLTRAVSDWEWENTAAFARRELELAGLDTLFTVPQGPETRDRWAKEMPRVFAGLPEIVRVKVWDRTASVLWSDEPQLIGQGFPDNDELQAALAGRVAVEITEPNKSEHFYERTGYAKLAEVYVPIFSKPGGEVIGVLEVYKTPVRLFATVQRGRWLVWAISLAGGCALYGVLLPLVRQVYGREVREETLRAHAAQLEAEIIERTRELQDQTKQFLQAQKMEAVGLLAGGVAHDFNNLLTVITGRSLILLHHLKPENPLRRNVELIQKTAERAATLTQQLLAFSRKQVLQPKVIDLNAVVAGMEKMLRRLIGEHIELVTVLEPPLGHVRADPGQVEQVILNLVVNARDAMPQGGQLGVETTNVDLDEAFVRQHPGARPGRYVLLAVTDSGVGMDAETQTHLFEPFFTTKEVGKGTGLGLATVYGIVKQSGGYIGVTTALGRGTRFEIYLPRVDEPVTSDEGGRVLGELLRGSETILLVEDQDEVRDFVRDVLQMSGYRVLAAQHGAAALRLVEQHIGPIHLLVTDVVMPQIGGQELAKRLGSARPDLRVLYISAYTSDAIASHGVLDGDVAFLAKPFTPEALAHKVRELLDAPHEGAHSPG